MDFFMTCKCGKQTELYGAFPHCRECQESICPDCSAPGEEDEERGRTLCKDCKAEAVADAADAAQKFKTRAHHCKFPELCCESLQCENWLRQLEGCEVTRG